MAGELVILLLQPPAVRLVSLEERISGAHGLCYRAESYVWTTALVLPRVHRLPIGRGAQEDGAGRC